MTKIVFFTTNNARIVYSDIDKTVLTQLPNIAVDPDLSRVAGLPPHLWKLQSGKIVPLTEGEIKFRELHIKNNGVDNRVVFDITPKPKPNKWLKPAVYAALTIALIGITLAAILICK